MDKGSLQQLEGGPIMHQGQSKKNQTSKRICLKIWVITLAIWFQSNMPLGQRACYRATAVFWGQHCTTTSGFGESLDSGREEWRKKADDFHIVESLFSLSQT